MTEKSRVKKDAFGWVDDVVDKGQAVEQPVSARKKRASSGKAVKTESALAEAKPEAVTNNNQRLIIVAYKNETGDIMASQELMFDSEGNGNISWSRIPADMAVKIFKLIGKLADKEIIEIHRNYKVTGSGKLEFKQG